MDKTGGKYENAIEDAIIAMNEPKDASVTAIRDYVGRLYTCFGSGMFILDPNCFHPGSRIRVKEFKYFNPKKWFISSRKYDPGCAFWILILTFYPSRISDPGVKKVPDPGSGSATLVSTYFKCCGCRSGIRCFLTPASGRYPVPIWDMFFPDSESQIPDLCL
jgi:hypothetical protein